VAPPRRPSVPSISGPGEALAWISGLYLWAAVHFTLAARTLPAELARARGSA